MNLYDFLEEHAKFPFPLPDESRSASTDDFSLLEATLLEKPWKASRAVRDNDLVEKLCNVLKDILKDTQLHEPHKDFLLGSFSPRLETDPDGHKNKSRLLIDKGLFEAARRCTRQYEAASFAVTCEVKAEQAGSRVDYLVSVNDQPRALVEAKSPSVMKALRCALPLRGIELKWVSGQSLVPSILSKAALYLGLRKMEWLFLTCHNYWIICRLVNDNDHPYLVYSPGISIENSSKPFQAFLGALLSTLKGVPVDPSPYGADIVLDTIEEEDHGPEPKDDINVNDASSDLMLTASSQNSPNDSQIWIPLRSFSNNTFLLPSSTNTNTNSRRLRLTRFIESGATGSVWECLLEFDNDKSNQLFAVKIVEQLQVGPSESDTSRRKRLRDEFDIYLGLEKVYQSGQLGRRIAPRCYGAYTSQNMDVLILELCDGVLHDWEELSASERSELYHLVQDLHKAGIIHGDLEPRNIGRARGGGGLCLFDFSRSRRHICREFKNESESEKKAKGTDTALKLERTRQCPELHELRGQLEALDLDSSIVDSTN